MSIRRNVSLASAAALIVLSFVLISSAGAETITVMHVSDTHTHLAAWGPHGEELVGTIGGYDRQAGGDAGRS